MSRAARALRWLPLSIAVALALAARGEVGLTGGAALLAQPAGRDGPAVRSGVRELAFAFVQGDFRAPLTCLVEGEPRQALRRVRIQPAPAQSARPAVRVTFVDLEAPPGTRCTSISGETEPNVIGTLELVWTARTRPDTGEVDFRNTLRREGGFDFKIDSGRLRVGPVEAGKGGERVVDFASGKARVEPVTPGSDAARRLAGLPGHRQLVLRVAAPDEPSLSFELVELHAP